MARRNGLSFYKRRKKISMTVIREIFSWIFGILVSVFLAVVIVYFFGMTTKVVGVSMEPTLTSEQAICIDRFRYILSSPKTGDVVIFLPNGNENSHYYTKRVIAVPGDKVLISEGILYVNGEETSYYTEKIIDGGIVANEYTLASGEYFCMGDNPNNSEDSRSANVGPVKEEYIMGKVWFRLKNEEGSMGFVR
ncbi:MAG: signal peptidase I [Lachnospiraceae bacterium]|nr:signal peptidase I [Lachnospiraceae bacterium]